MKKRVLSLLLVLVMVLGMLPTGALAADTATGVSSQEELAEMTDGGSYVLTQDIALDESWTAIDFSGTLDGNGYTITLNGQPLFNDLTGTVQNLLLDGSVTSNGNIGALCKTINTGATVQNCWSGADVTTTASAGYASGFTGKIVDGLIQDCLATGELTGGKWGGTYGIAVGGKADAAVSPQVQNCWFLNGKKGVQYDNQYVSHTCTQVENGDYTAALEALNTAAAESGLLTWALDGDGIPKPAHDASGGDGGDEGGGATEKTELEQLIAQAEGLQEKDYAAGSWADLKGILSSAEEAQSSADEAKIEKATRNLETVLSYLVTVDSYKKLKDAYDTYETTYLPNYENYTSASWSAVSSAASTADGILYTVDTAAEDSFVDNQYYTDKDVLDAYQALTAAIAGLQEIGQVEIKTVDDLKAMDGGKQYTLAADLELPDTWESEITLSGTFDGNGHVITMQGGGPLFRSISGTVRNLGLTGTVNGSGAFAEELSGTIFNCYSWADVDNGTQPAGGAVGASTGSYGGTISNTYVSGQVTGNPAYGLASAEQYYGFLGSYWVNGVTCSTQDEPDTDLYAGTQMTLEAMQSGEFLATLNGDTGDDGVTWNRSESGLPYFGENVAESGALPYTVQFTDILDQTQTTISDKSQTLDTDVFGEPGGYVGTLALLDYDGTVRWKAASTSTVVNEPVILSTKGEVFVRAPGQVKVTASNASTGDEILSFTMNVTVPQYTLSLKVGDTDYTDKTYSVTGNEDIYIEPYVTVAGSGESIAAYRGLFTWASSDPSKINVNTDGSVNIKAPGTVAITVSLGDETATMNVSVDKISVTGIEGNFEGTYYVHRRNPNSIGQSDLQGAGAADFNPLRNLDENGEEDLTSQYRYATVTPSNATIQGTAVQSSNPGVVSFVGGTFQALVPVKPGTTQLTFTSLDPAAAGISDTTDVTIAYLNPLQSLAAKETDLTVEVGQTIDAGLIFKGVNDNAWPEKYPNGLHVSESGMTWTQSGDGQVTAYRAYPIYMPDDEGYSLAEGSVANDHWLIKGVKPGTVTLTGTAVDATNGTKTVTLTVHVTGDVVEDTTTASEKVANAADGASKYVYDSMTTPGFTDEWRILGLARCGYPVSETFYETYYASAVAKIQEEADAESRPWGNTVTDTQRLALALIAIGKDPTNVEGVNLLDYSWNKETYFPKLGALGVTQGSNELIFALLAIEANDALQASRPASVTMTEEQMVAKLLSDYQCANGSFGLSDNLSGGVDITAMALQALAKHKDEPEVREAIDKALAYLKGVQSPIDGGYGNCESTAQVALALCELGLDPDTYFDLSLVDALLAYGLENGSFRHTITGDSNGMATEQALYTLAGMNRFYQHKNSLYNMNDVVFDTTAGTAVTGVTLTPNTAEVTVGKTVQLTALVIPVSAANRNVTYQSSDDAIATVSETGLVTGVKAGTATITVTTVDGQKTATATITVKEPGGSGTTPEEKATVTLSIDKLTIGKGYVLAPTKVEITVGESVWDVLKRELDERDIDYDYSFYEQYNSVYVESIAGDGEFDHGSGSGWMYNVDGVYPDYGCSLYVLNGGEKIEWRYTTNLGLDLGRDYGTGGSGGSGTETGGTTEIKPEVKPDSSGAAQVAVSDSEMKDAIATAKTEGSDAIVIAPQITGEATKVTAEVPTQSLKDVVKNTDAALEVQTDVGSVSIPNDALDAMAQQAGGSTVTIMVEAKNATDVKEQVSASQLEDAAVVEVTITSGKKELTTFGGKSLTITIPVPSEIFADGELYKVIVLSADGTRETVAGACTKQNGKLSVQVKIAHLSTFVVTTQKAMPFTDVTGHWAAKAIAWAYQNNLMNGTGETTFAPNATLNRAMLATILYRLAGSPARDGEGFAFTDVALDAWYSDAVAWASENGIVSGMGDGTFAPTNAITREQLAAMLYRYAQYSKLDTSAKGDLSKFTDGRQVASWASDAMAWAVGSGLLSGKTADTLDPAGTATRAEVATILMRFAGLAQ